MNGYYSQLTSSTMSRNCMGGFYTPPWLYHLATLTSLAWKPCWDYVINVLSSLTHRSKVSLMNYIGGYQDLTNPLFPDPYQLLTLSLTPLHSQMLVQALVVTTSTNSGFTAMIGYSQYLIMPKHLSKELAEPMNINWKTSSQVSTGLRMDKCQSSNIVVNKLKTS